MVVIRKFFASFCNLVSLSLLQKKNEYFLKTCQASGRQLVLEGNFNFLLTSFCL